MEQQNEAGSLGMWWFLLTEIMFFGGMFTAYTVYRHMYFDAFAAASNALSIRWGAFNTAVLIGSSLTMALAVYHAQMGNNKKITLFLLLTVLLGGVFLGVKYIEYSAKFEEHIFPAASNFQWPPYEAPTAGHEEVQQLADPTFTGHVRMYFFLYFVMTGFHATHMIIGIGILLVLARQSWKGKFSKEYHSYIELFGLYWHFVDIVWIFLFPLLYLVDRHL